MDVATLTAGLATEVGNFGTQLGPIVLTIVGFAVGIYALRYGWGFLRTLLRVAPARV